MYNYFSSNLYVNQMKKFNKVVLIAMSTLVAACSPSKPDIVIEQRLVDVEVVNVDRPKRYKVTFKNLSTGEVVKKSISKRCSSHNKIRVGQKHQLQMVVKQTEDKQQYTEYTNLKAVFCPK